MTNKPFNEDTGLHSEEPIPNNLFVLLVAIIILIVVALVTWKMKYIILTAGIEAFIWIWYLIIFNFKSK